ncbi:MAG: 4-(cytidine 5'-diphospho)-2-C-methyl-D-erythritol kinase [Clostridia bacterium]|nr:4-(cytidine 5'-diphospho)-2-C-methyl-D-erythritol kinase [Clostridia bacterium]
MIEAHGKLNLSLDILRKRDDGYHDVAMIMQSVALCDYVSVEQSKGKEISVYTNHPDVPNDKRNLAYRACQEMISEFGLDCGFRVEIEKHIPVAGGMAGGSTDAAAVIKAINQICGLNLTEKRMMEIGLRLGADVPFCIQERPALATGIGEILTHVCGLPEYLWILLVNPNRKVSTKIVYEMIDRNLIYGTVNNDAICEALASGNITAAAKHMKNVMESVSVTLCPQIRDILQNIQELGALHAMMSGSGATCFGIFDRLPDVRRAQELFHDCYVELTKPLVF